MSKLGHKLRRFTVEGHAGELVFGFMGETKVPVVLLVGRVQSVYVAGN